MSNLRPIPRVNSFHQPALQGLLGKSAQELVLIKYLKTNSPEALEARVSLARWILSHEPVTYDAPAARKLNNPVWAYWDSSYTDWPEIVKACDRSRRQYFGENLITLSDQTIHEYVDVPDWVQAKRSSFSKTHFSDLLRLLLLRQYGGTWVDATVFMSSKAPQVQAGTKFFGFSRPSDPFLLSNWFLSSTLNSHVVKTMLDMMLAYWRDFSEQSHYFNFHFAFEILYFTDHKFRREWLSSLTLSHVPPHLMQSELGEIFSQEKFDAIISCSAVHKLTYKVSDEIRNNPDNFFNRICELK